MNSKADIGFREIDAKLDRVINAMATTENVKRIETRIDALEEKFDRRFHDVMVALDGLVKVVTDMQREYAAISAKLARYEEWFKILAKKTGVKLPI